MNAQLDETCARNTDGELDLIADFLRRPTGAWCTATEEPSRDRPPGCDQAGTAWNAPLIAAVSQ